MSEKAKAIETAMTNMTKGAMWFMSAQALFVLAGFAIHIFLARWLTPDVYGLWGIVISILVLAEYSMMSILSVTATKLVSENNMAVGSVARVILRLQMLVAILMGVGLFGMASSLAGFMHDDRLTFYFRLAVLDIPLTALFLTYCGLLSGLMQFSKRTLVVGVYSITKMVGIPLLVVLGYSLTGAIIGKICASGLAVLVAFRLCRYEHNTQPVAYSKLVGFSTPVFFLSITTAVLGSMGLFCLKALSTDPMAPGFYTAINNVAKAPRMVFRGVTGALFPSFSSAISAGDAERGAGYVAQSFRLLFLIVLPTVFVVIATAEELVTLVFTEVYLPAVLPLQILMIGVFLAGLTRVTLTAITAENRPRLALGITLIQIPVALVLFILLIPKFGLEGAAVATIFTSAIGGCIGLSYLLKKYRKGLVPINSLLKITLASLLLLSLVQLLFLFRIPLLLQYLVLVLSYLSLLWLMNEVTQSEKRWFKNIVSSIRSTCSSTLRKARWRVS